METQRTETNHATPISSFGERALHSPAQACASPCYHGSGECRPSLYPGHVSGLVLERLVAEQQGGKPIDG